MSRISELNDYKLGKLKGKCTDYPNKRRLNTSDENYRRGYKVGKKAQSKDVLESAFSDSVRSELKALIAEYRKTRDSKLYSDIIEKYQNFSNMQLIKDADDEEYVLMENEDGDFSLAKKFGKDNLEQAKEYLNNNADTTIVGQDEDGGIYITEKKNNERTEENKTVEEKKLKDNKMKQESEYRLNRINDSSYSVYKDGDAAYKLVKINDHWSCTCSGFYYRGSCKHIDLLRGKVADSELVSVNEAHTRKECEQIHDAVAPMLKGWNWEMSGDYRRGADTIASLPIVVECSDSAFRSLACKLSDLSNNRFKTIIADSSIIRGYYDSVPTVFLRAADGQLATHLLSTTGSKDENVRLRKKAKDMGYRLVEEGLFDSTGALVKTPSERSIYNILNEKYKEPYER